MLADKDDDALWMVGYFERRCLQMRMMTQIFGAYMEDYKHSELTGKIIGCALQVHSFLGNGFQEIIYQKALALELAKAGLKFQQEFCADIFYKDYKEPLGTRRVDFLVEGLVLIELKALNELDDIHVNQVLNYLRIYKIEVGLLLNFGENRLNTKRFALTKK